MMFPTENIPMPENESEEAVANVETTPVTEGNSEKSGDSEKPEDYSAEQSDSNILIAYFTWAENTLSVMVSGEAHYSVERAAKIMGIPGKNIIKVPVGGGLWHPDRIAGVYIPEDSSRRKDRILCCGVCLHHFRGSL